MADWLTKSNVENFARKAGKSRIDNTDVELYDFRKPVEPSYGSLSLEDAPYDVEAFLDRENLLQEQRQELMDEDDRLFNEYLANKELYKSWEPVRKYETPFGTFSSFDNDNSVTYAFEPGKERMWRAIDDIILGYDPKEGADGYEYYEDNIPFEAYFVPGVGEALYAGKTIKDIKNGRIPGALDLVFGGGIMSGIIKGAKRGGKAFMRGYNAGKARRMAEMEANRNYINNEYRQPKMLLMDKDGKVLLRNEDKYFDRQWR